MTVESLPLPSGWSWTRLDRVANVNARIGWKALTAAEYTSDGYVFLATPNIKNRDIDFDNVNYISEFRYEESPELKLQPGDVLLAKDGNTLGIVNIVRKLPRPATVNGSIAVIRTNGIDPRFLLYTLSSSTIQTEISTLKGGMGVPHLFQWDINRLKFPIPSLEEQCRIANFLDNETSRIDDLNTLRRKQQKLLEERRYSAVSEILLPGILKEVNGGPISPWLPVLPDDRPLVRLGYVCQLQNGLTVDAKRRVEAGSVTRPYLRVANVQAGRLSLDSVARITVPAGIAARCTLRAGDVLMTEGGDLDKLGRGTVWNGELPDCLHQNHVFAIRPDPARLDGNYLALMTQTLHGRCYFESTGVKTTNLASTNSGKIMSFRIPLPPLAKQQELVSEVSQALLAVERAKDALNRQLSLLAERRQALITAAVTGQFDVTTASGRNLTQGV
ncbi:restriction endonuclease subunit S [Nocardia nova]|uniref:restriction endonuclease subunit S n=1 Tax=Nocardia nova TaxID=37330 RepID=UPI000CEA49D1|nr:restriction endonuclease subunit S [Nocardia nova]PPI99117.1 type I restriction endonuclease subunit S [Nocardia nova]